MKKLTCLILAAALLALAACQAAQPNLPLILGEQYLAGQDYEQALLQFKQAPEPGSPRVCLGKADALLHLDRREEAAGALAASAKQLKGKPRKAIMAARTEVSKSAEDGYAGLAAAYEALGLTDMSFALLKRVKQEFPFMQKIEAAFQRLAQQLGIAAEPTTQATTAETVTETTTATTTLPPTTTQQPKPTAAEEISVSRIELSRYFSPAGSGWFNVGDETLADHLGLRLTQEEGTDKTFAGSAVLRSQDGQIISLRWSDQLITLYGVKPGDPYDDFVAAMESRNYHFSAYSSHYFLDDGWLSFEAGQSGGVISYFEVGGLTP